MGLSWGTRSATVRNHPSKLGTYDLTKSCMKDSDLHKAPGGCSDGNSGISQLCRLRIKSFRKRQIIGQERVVVNLRPPMEMDSSNCKASSSALPMISPLRFLTRLLAFGLVEALEVPLAMLCTNMAESTLASFTAMPTADFLGSLNDWFWSSDLDSPRIDLEESLSLDGPAGLETSYP